MPGFKESRRRLAEDRHAEDQQHQLSSSLSTALVVSSRVTNQPQSVDEMPEHVTSSNGVSKTGRPRGRKPSARVPCDECIARASAKNDGASIELCEKCLSTLHRPRKKQQLEQPNVKRVRRQTNAIIDSAL